MRPLGIDACASADRTASDQTYAHRVGPLPGQFEEWPPERAYIRDE